MLKKLLVGTGIVLVVLILLVLVFVGPWPTYAATDVTTESYFKDAIQAADESLQQTSVGASGQLHAGWASERITPETGTPLAGFGDRQGRPSTGVHDELYVKAVAVSDGTDTTVIVGADMLIVPNNIADRAREKAMAATDLQPGDILFNASHTHSGPGAWAPGLAASLFGGAYDESVMERIGDAFGTAIINAYGNLKPASYARGDVDVPDHIKNRAHEGPVDSELNYLILKHANGDTCHVVSYGAHATVIGSSNMEFSGDYPGYLERAIETQTGGMAIFLAGAVGSMSPRIDGTDGFTKAETLGSTLAEKVLADAEGLSYSESADVASAGFSFETPPLQLRLNQNWRLSPNLFPLVGLDDTAWISGVKIGDMFFYGTPCDMSGEISLTMKSWAQQQGIDLWVLSFAGDYIGYVSPQKYYDLPREETHEYEMYLMSWIGPNQEAFFTEMLHHLVDSMGFQS
ncbi:MAG: hypothetical protein AMXMBFR82_00760 [Candidatus Hydrogenedentota bacterium]